MRTGVRFTPPRRRLRPEETWVLRRAFGTPGTAAGRVDGASTADIALRCGLAGAIAARHSTDRLETEIGAEATHGLSTARQRAVANALRYEIVAERIDALADATSIRVVLLKGYALHRVGDHLAGARAFSDLDVLVSTEAARELHDRCTSAEYRAADAPANEHHLPTLVTPEGGNVDIHFALHGITAGSRALLDGARIFDLGAVDQVDGTNASFVPERSLLASHALAHSIDQHGFSPDNHCLLRSYLDLAALLPDRASWEAVRHDVVRWTQHSLSDSERTASEELTIRLVSGEVDQLEKDLDDPASILLRHLLASSLDRGYRSALGTAHLKNRLRHATAHGLLLGYIRRKLTGLAQYGSSAGPGAGSSSWR